MMDSNRRAAQAVRALPPQVETVCDELAARVPAAERALLTEFARLFLAKAPAEFYDDRSTGDVAALVLGAFRQLQQARPERVDVQVFDATTSDEGWSRPVTVIRTNVSERPFIVDTLREHLHGEEQTIEWLLHPVLRVVRDAEGRVVEVGPGSSGEPRESLVHCEIAEVEPERLEALRDGVRSRLQDTVRATEDFGAMLDALQETVDYLEELRQSRPDRAGEIEEVQKFLLWLQGGAFVFLGYRGYDLVDATDGRAIVVEPGSGLGILRNEGASSFARPVPLADLKPELRERIEDGPLLITSKTNALSSVHRRARMDYIGVKKMDEHGVRGERRFIGLFTSQAYSEDAERIPILREKLKAVLDDAGLMPGSHDFKETISIFNSMPKEELFLASAEQIGNEIQSVLTHYHTGEVLVTLRPDPLGRGVSVMVVMPKERFSGEVRKAIEDVLAARFRGDVLNYHLALGAGDQARLHFYVAAPSEDVAAVAPEEIERDVERLIRSWTDRVREGLEEDRTPEEARRLSRRYSRAFSAEYMAATDPGVAEQDIVELEAMSAAGRNVAIRLTNPSSTEGIAVDEPVTRLKLYLRGQRLVLSDFMPILENAGLRVIAVSPFDVVGDDVEPATIYVFAVQDAIGRPLDIETRGEALAGAILAVRAGDATNDSLNGLILTAGLAWREVDVLRAYAEYAFQLGAVPSRVSLPKALLAYPDAARLLFEIFRVKFHPEQGLRTRDGESEALRLQREFIRSLEGVGSLADDRALRRLLNIIDATVRTNYYRSGAATPTQRSGGAPYLAFKLAADALQSIARTRLLYEVWVHSTCMAGIHLRAASVARGGIRFSDRPDDFRTEVLGLVRTQTVKNGVIVPGGSKGGFIVKRPKADRQEMAREVAEQYRTLIRGLLDLTDNLVDGEVAHPPDVVVYDGPDPYLVVAADKGTAHLSDVANGVAAEYDFWLGDAFASGGSNGYDHKAVGITAKGAWVCVQRHFREMGRDIQTEPFTVVGIGDMSGDVFGNGMLLSREIRLIAAFDHRHIFVDPDPDAEASYRERERLFNAGPTSWADYDTSLISQGGFVVPRASKEVRLGPEVRRALGLGEEEVALDGESLIRAILAAPADLLWNGGIGTYVKSRHESHGDVGDSANDAVRVNAADLRVKVIGEGGNLGLTQAARIQLALDGGRLNTDALDNSGGVDMSDHEVNLKILLGAVLAEGRLDLEARNRLLRELTEPVTELVLDDNRSQSLAVSLDELRAHEALEEFHGLGQWLEKLGLIGRGDEGIPSNDVLAERRSQGRSMTRPELAVLLAYAKLATKRALLRSPLMDDTALQSYLVGYFPERAVEVAGAECLQKHRLRREIIATQLTNDMVDLMGAGFMHRMVRDTGATMDRVARAWVIAARLCGARALRENLVEVEAELPAAAVYRWLLGLARVLERTSRWVLRNIEEDAPAADVIAGHVEGLGTLRQHFGDIVAGQERALFEARVRELRQVTSRHDLAQRLITLRFLDQLLEILRVAGETGADPLRVARAYYLISELLEVPWLRDALAEAAGEDRWDQREAQAILDDLGRAHRILTGMVVADGRSTEPVEEVLARVRQRRNRELSTYRQLLDEIRADDRPRLSALAVAVREFQTLGG